VLVFIGNNDVLDAVRQGTPSVLTPVSSFAADYASLVTKLAAMRIPNVVIANLPDPTTTPFVVPAPALLLLVPGVRLQNIRVDGQPLSLTDSVLLPAVDILQAQGNASTLVLPGYLVLTAGEMAQIRIRGAAFNAAIRAAVTLYNATADRSVSSEAIFVDVASAVQTINASGVRITWDTPIGRLPFVLTTRLFGGLYSLDAFHPGNSGYAVVANVFIDAINTRLPASARIRRADISQVAAADPVVPFNIVNPFTGTSSFNACAAQP
jgi:hypothetical protein